MKGGERQWVLTAGEADYSADKTTLKLTDAVVTMVSSDGKPVVVNSPHADLTMNGNHVTKAYLTGGTVIHFGDYVLSTDSATFMPDDDQVEAPGLVTVIGDGLKVTGVGLSGHPKTRVFDLHTQVQTEVMPKSNSEKPKQSQLCVAYRRSGDCRNRARVTGVGARWRQRADGVAGCRGRSA